MKDSINNIIKIIQDYLEGAVAKSEFDSVYPELLKIYEEEINDSAYYPLDILAPSKHNSDASWKENMKSMYLSEIEKLDKLLEDNEPSYSEQMSKKKQKEHCREALERIPIELRDRDSKIWIEKNLIDDEEISFFDENGDSIFGFSSTIYKNKLDNESFLLTALNGNLKKIPHNYESLLNQLRTRSDGVGAAWMKCYDVDGFACVESCNNFQDPYGNLEAIRWIEHIESQDTQGGICNLMLLCENKDWMFVLTNNFQEFLIELHGNEAFIKGVLDGA